MTDIASDSERELLKARARALAATPPSAPEGARLDVIEFTLADEHYAVETAFVVEVQPLQHLTALPGTPPFLLGIIHLRGRILAVVDLKRFLDLPTQGLTDLHRVIVLRNDTIELAVLADQVIGSRSLREDSLHDDVHASSGIRSEFLRGVTADRLTVLHTSRFLQDPRLVVDESATR